MRMPDKQAYARVAVLDVDPDLGTGLEPAEFEQASRLAVARVMALEPPGWDAGMVAEEADQSWLGLLMTEGLLIRNIAVGRRRSCELFGPGDLIRPWDADGEYAPLVVGVSWRVLVPTRLAVLDGAFSARMARWPSLHAQLLGRVARRARHLALVQAVTHLPRIHTRLVLLFWLLAERWGRFGPDGVRIELPLTHEVLALLVGAQRPSVTVALQRLNQANLLLRPGRNRWLLTRGAVERLESPESLELLDILGSAEEPQFANIV
jgi:CRP/FNR family cyclic AMP-dependent transcriptional regulator